MATGTNGIATRADIHNLCKCACADETSCPNKAELTTGNVANLVTVSNASIIYADPQLVKYSDIALKKTQTINVKVYNGRASGTLGIKWIDVNLIASDGQSVEVAGADWSSNISNGATVEKNLTFTIPDKIGTHTVDLGKNSYQIQIRIGELDVKRALRAYASNNSTPSSSNAIWKHELTDVKIGYVTIPFNYPEACRVDDSACFLGGEGVTPVRYVRFIGSNT